MGVEIESSRPSLSRRSRWRSRCSRLHGTRIVTGWTREAGFRTGLAAGGQSFECKLTGVDIRPGQTVLVNLTLATEAGVLIDEVEAAVVLDVVGDDRHAHLSTNADQGVWVAPQTWRRTGGGA